MTRRRRPIDPPHPDRPGRRSQRVDLDYDDLGRRETLTRYADLAGTALVAATGYAFDLNSRLTGLTHAQGSTVFADYGYAFDAVGRLIEESTLAETRKHYYDASGQLTAVDSSLAGRDENYAYDQTGNRTSNGGQAGTGNRLLEDANYTYQYDAEGNRSQRTSKTDGSRDIYWWDHRNRLVRVNFRTAANVLTQAVAYDYDAFDNLVRRRVDANGDGTFEESQSFVLDLGGKGRLDDVVLTFDESGNVEHRYLHGDGIDELWADESTADGLLWALADRQGTVNDWAEHDSGTGTTTVTNHVEFDAYGNIVSQTNASHEITAGGYTGRYHDPLTGLRYHRGRWTDPATGWISPDPIGFLAGDVNLTAYVGNSPASFTDPSGLAANWHHLLPQQFAKRFSASGLDIHSAEFGWVIDEAYHTGKGGLHPSGWNRDWQDFWNKYPRGKVPVSEIFKQLRQMKKDYRCLLEHGRQATIAYGEWTAVQKQLNRAAKMAKAGRGTVPAKILRRIGGKTVVIGVIIFAYDSATGGVEAAAQGATEDALWPYMDIARAAGNEIGGAVNEKMRTGELERQSRSCLINQLAKDPAKTPIPVRAGGTLTGPDYFKMGSDVGKP